MAMSVMLHEEKFPDFNSRKSNAFGEAIEPMSEGQRGQRFLPKDSTTDPSYREGDSRLFRWLRVEKKKKMSKEEAAPAPSLPIPEFGDLGKKANDLINKDFYHASQANLEVKLKAPNGTHVTVKGKQGFDSVTTASVEGKHALKPHGRQSLDPLETPPAPTPKKNASSTSSYRFFTRLPSPLRTQLYLAIFGIARGEDSNKRYALTYRQSGVTITQIWTTASLLDSKVELTDVVAPGAKIDLQNLWNPSKAASAAQKLTFAYKTPTVHARSLINYAQASGNIDAVLDVVAGHEGFLLGGEAGYDLQKAAVTKYSLGLGYQTPSYIATLTGTQNLGIIAASYYQKVNESTEVSAKVGYDVNAAKASGLELASKYKLDPMSFAKAKVNDRGIAALAYNTKLNQGTTLGLGLSLDLNKLNEAGHKIGTHLEFEG